MKAHSLTRRQFGRISIGTAAAAVFPLPLLAQTVRFPTKECNLTRRLSRGLRDGKYIVVARTWRITFTAQARGISISGEQMSVSVEAPEQLALLAEIEEARSSDGIFPILLAPDGTIMAAGQSTSQSSFDAAVRTAQDLMARGGFEEGTVAKQGTYMAQLQQAGSSLLDELPGDLFFPSTEPFRDVRTVTLPDGSFGEFEIIWEASVKAGTQWLEKAQREVITRIADSERRSVEEWSLSVL